MPGICRGSPHATEVEHSGPSLSRFAAMRSRVEQSQPSQSGQADYPGMRESGSGDGHTPLMGRGLYPSSTRRFSEDVVARRRALAGLSSTNLEKRRCDAPGPCPAVHAMLPAWQ